MNKKVSVVILGCIILLGFLLRLYGFNNPVADWHSWRQAETAAVSRNFVKDGIDLLHPRMDNISNVQSGMDNPQGYFFVEFPLYNAAQAGLFTVFGGFTIEQWGMLVTIFASLFSTLFLYLIVSRHSNDRIGLLAAFFFAFLPFNIYYGRVILVESSMVMAILGGIYFFDRWIEFYSSSDPPVGSDQIGAGGESRSPSGSSRHLPAMHSKALQAGARTIKNLFFFLAVLFTSAASLLKPFAVFFVLPMVYLAFKVFGFGLFKKWQLWVFALITVAPLVAWRLWMTQFPEGIPANAWLLNGNGIRFRPAFFRWMLYERLTILISGYFGMIFAILGLYKIWKLKEWPFFVSFFVSSVVYITVFATGNVQHDYYQILIMPSVAILFAIGAYFLLNLHFVIPTDPRRGEWRDLFNQATWVAIIVLICLVGGFYLSWQRVKEYYYFNPSLIAAGEAVQRLTEADAKVIANYNGDSSFLYQANRKGWASFQDPLPVMIEKGADYLVLVNPTENDMVFGKTYKVVERTKQYVIFDLRKRS